MTVMFGGNVQRWICYKVRVGNDKYNVNYAAIKDDFQSMLNSLRNLMFYVLRALGTSLLIIPEVRVLVLTKRHVGSGNEIVTLTHLCAIMTRKSCALGTRNTILRQQMTQNLMTAQILTFIIYPRQLNHVRE